MRVTVSHDKNPEEVKRNIDKGFEDIFRGIPIGPVQFTDQQRAWNGSTLNFSFNARAGFMIVPIKGFVMVEPKLLTIDVDLPAFLNQFIPEQKVKTALESQVKGLLT